MAAKHFGIAPETTWNTLVAPTTYMEAQSEKLKLDKTEIVLETIRSRAARRRYVAKRIVGGQPPVFPANYQELGEYLYYLMGTVDVSGSGPYTHTIPASTGIADRKPFTAESMRDGATNVWRWGGCQTAP